MALDLRTAISDSIRLAKSGLMAEPLHDAYARYKNWIHGVSLSVAFAADVLHPLGQFSGWLASTALVASLGMLIAFWRTQSWSPLRLAALLFCLATGAFSTIIWTAEKYVGEAHGVFAHVFPSIKDLQADLKTAFSQFGEGQKRQEAKLDNQGVKIDELILQNRLLISSLSRDEVVWGFIRGTRDAALLRQFVLDFPTSSLKTQVELQIASLAGTRTSSTNLIFAGTLSSDQQVGRSPFAHAVAKTIADEEQLSFEKLLKGVQTQVAGITSGDVSVSGYGSTWGHRLDGRTEKRVALAVGNSIYRVGSTIADLPTAENDASLVAEALRQLGFETISLRNLNYAEFLDALSLFAAVAKEADVVVVYLAGHALQVGGSNFALPVGMKLDDAFQLRTGAIQIEQVEHAMSGAKRVLLLLDYGRASPFEHNRSNRSR